MFPLGSGRIAEKKVIIEPRKSTLRSRPIGSVSNLGASLALAWKSLITPEAHGGSQRFECQLEDSKRWEPPAVSHGRRKYAKIGKICALLVRLLQGLANSRETRGAVFTIEGQA